MSASIGKGSLTLTANAGPLAADLSGAHSKITSWAGRVKSSFGGALSGVGKLAAPIYVAQAAFQAVSGTISAVTDRVSEIANIGRTSRALGIDPADLQALGNAAKRVGVELPEFGQMFGKLQAKIAQGGPDTAAALSQIGLSLESLQGMSGKDALFAIADGLANTSDAGTRSAVAMKLFEEAGLKMLPMLSKGGASLRAFVDEQKASGAVLSGSQVAMAEVADGAMAKAGEAISRVWDKIVIAVAPVVAAIADLVAEVVDFLAPAFEWGGKAITEVFKTIAIVGGYVWDSLKVGVGAVAAVLSVVVDYLGLVFRALKNVYILASDLPDWLGGGLAKHAAEFAGSAQNGYENLAKSMRSYGAEALNDFGGTANRIQGWLDGVEKKKQDVMDMSPVASQIGAITNTMNKANGGAKVAANMGAIFKGSKEDYSLRTSFAMGDMGTEPVVAAIRVLTDVQQKALEKMPDRQAIASEALILKEF
jgi:hypothetical protein